ncbi:MAG: hypothetical protein ACT6QS_02015 [Flavobacteriales bacterium]
MEPHIQILNWLVTAFEQPPGSLTERFYYDRRDHEFFSVLVVDYFIFDRTMKIAKGISTTYSEEQLKTLAARIKKIEKKHHSILEVPRVLLEERKQLMHRFIRTLPPMPGTEDLWRQAEDQDYRSKLDFNFDEQTDKTLFMQWKEMKRGFLEQQATAFLENNHINIGTASLWIIDSEISVSIDLEEETSGKAKNGWWKFW